MPALTCRDAAANDVLHLLDKTELRDDCPTQLCEPAKLHRDEPANTESATDTDEALEARLPESGNAIGFLHVLLKTELEMDGDSDEKHKEILENFSKVKTLRHAQDYVRTIKAKMDAASDQPG